MKITNNVSFNKIETPEEYKEKVMLTVKDIRNIFDISLSRAYEICDGSYFPIVYIGKSIRIPTITFFKWMNDYMYSNMQH